MFGNNKKLKTLFAGKFALLFFLSSCTTTGSIANGNNTTSNNSVNLDNSGAKLELVSTNFIDTIGNGDNIANRGESIQLYPIFSNTSSFEANNLTINISTTSTYAKTGTNYIFISKLGAGESLKNKEVSFSLEISKELPPGTGIPVIYTITDSSGNTFNINDIIKVEEIDNKLIISNKYIKDKEGNTNNTVNIGSSIYIQPTFTNSGKSATNDLTVEILTTSPNAMAGKTPIYIKSIKPGLTSPRLFSEALYLEINKNTQVGEKIPIIYRLTDKFGNKWEINDLISVSTVGAKLNIAKTELVELYGNGDNIPNRGESLKVYPAFTNTGFSVTNNLTVNIYTKNSYVSVGSEHIHLNAIKPEETSVPELNSSEYLSLKINKDFTPDSEIPIIYTLTDDSTGKSFDIETKIKVPEIDNKVILASKNLKEVSGNGDNVINRGESFFSEPTFTNSGKSATNDLTVNLSTSSRYASINDSEIYIKALKPGVTTTKSPADGFHIDIDKGAKEGDFIPLTYTLTDKFGNKWEIKETLTVKELDVKFELSKTNLSEITGNGDNLANKGELLQIYPTLKNTGISATNNLTISLSTNSSYATSGNNYIQINTLKPGMVSTFETITNNYLSLKINNDVPPATKIPITYTIIDSFGNEWKINDTVLIN